LRMTKKNIYFCDISIAYEKIYGPMTLCVGKVTKC